MDTVYSDSALKRCLLSCTQAKGDCDIYSPNEEICRALADDCAEECQRSYGI